MHCSEHLHIVWKRLTSKHVDMRSKAKLLKQRRQMYWLVVSYTTATDYECSHRSHHLAPLM